MHFCQQTKTFVPVSAMSFREHVNSIGPLSVPWSTAAFYNTRATCTSSADPGYAHQAKMQHFFAMNGVKDTSEAKELAGLAAVLFW